MKREPDRIVVNPAARQSRPFDRRLALHDPLVRRAVPVVERHDALVGTPHQHDVRLSQRVTQGVGVIALVGG